ncbi:uncharacterized protein LOC129580814 isoform X1 [Paramacrobiotus metropolitanus]|uniref:uncharacterized protein LOC129580814 isoform X1 n=1 Tax=Paramacrobiotus metropolitanus TaxID=2943436 RepID=UPI002445E998|nr:uncharacterized protein LOC129580814 isoform X1 [Paramacrobiotus metropolitanus]
MEEPSAELRPTVDECEFISDEEFFSLSHLQQSYYLKTAPEEQVKRIKEKRAELDLQKKSQYCQKRSAKKKLDRKLAKEKIEKEKQCGIFENVAPFEKLFLHRSQHVHTAYAKKVSKYLVRIFKTDSEMLQKMYAAVATGDSLDTSCVACGDDLYIRHNNREIPLHQAVIRSFRGPGLQLIQRKTCCVEKGEICINPYHYERESEPVVRGGYICVVFGCSNRSDKSKDVSYFQVPDKNDARYKAFFAFCGRKDLEQSGFLTSHHICSAHFRRSDISLRGKYPRMKPTAVPTKHPGSPYFTKISQNTRRDIGRSTAKEQEKIIAGKFWKNLCDARYDQLINQHGFAVLVRSDSEILLGKVTVTEPANENFATDALVLRMRSDLIPAVCFNGVTVLTSDVTECIGCSNVSSSRCLTKLLMFNFKELKREILHHCRAVNTKCDQLMKLIKSEPESANYDFEAHGESAEDEEASSEETDFILKQQIHSVARFAKEIINSASTKSSQRRYSPWMKRLCAVARNLSSGCYGFLRRVLGAALPHSRTLRDHTAQWDIEDGEDIEHMIKLGEFCETIPDSNRDVNLICDATYQTEQVEYINGSVIGLAENNDEVIPAKNVLIFIIQSVVGNVRKIVSYHFVKNLKGSDLAKILLRNLRLLGQHTKFRANGLCSDHGAENAGCRGILGVVDNTFPWRFRHPLFPEQFVIIILDISHLLKRIWANILRISNGGRLCFGSWIFDITLLQTLFEIERCSPVKYAPDITRKVLWPNTFEKMCTRTAEGLFTDRTVGALTMLTTQSPDHPLLIKIAEIRREDVNAVRFGLQVILNFANFVRGFYYPLTTSSIQQAQRFRQPLFEVITLNNIDTKFDEMLESLSGIGPHPDCILQSLPRQTWLGLNATIHGIREISRISLEAGAEYILARKQCSDPIEELNAAIKFGTTKLTAATVRQNISHIEAYQQLTESPNVGSRYKTRKRIIEISDEPLPKRQRTSRHPLRDYCFSFSNELEIIRDPEPCPVEDRTEKLMREDRKLWICSEMLQIVLCPWETLDDTNTDAGLAGLFNNAIADVTAALARTADQKSKCDSCRGQLVEVFSSGSELPGAAYVGARSRAEYGGLCLPRKQAFTLCSRAYTLFIKVTEIPAFVKSKSHLAVILKLMLLKMNLSDFHPL